ncbi:MAG: hemerythrin domain-containing protein [Alphaproteobacteria bacterium]|nr:hemerythrin domain-containing protein [Alphaproteobacteria bacterium]
MDFQRRIPQLLHEDHQATIMVIEALDDLLARAKKTAPDVAAPDTKRILNQVANAIREEISSHFAFEENELFTRLEQAGDVGIGMHLREEHKALLPLGQQVSALASQALQDGFDPAGWSSFRDLSAELIERMFAHIQKEEMALLPMLDDLLEPEDDMELASAYSQSH